MMSPKEHQYNVIKSQEEIFSFWMYLNCLSLYCLKHFIQLIQQLFPVGLYKHMINVRFENPALLSYFDVFYFELFCVSVWKHAHMHTHAPAYTHTWTHTLERPLNDKSQCQHISTGDTGGAHQLHGGELSYHYNWGTEMRMSKFLSGSLALVFYVNAYHLNNHVTLNILKLFKSIYLPIW